MKHLFILRGVPGAGKSTLARFLAETLPDAVALSADDWMFSDGKTYDRARLMEAHSNCESAAEEAMRFGKTHIILHNTFTEEWQFEFYLRIADYFGYRVTSLVVENRHGHPSVHVSPAENVRVCANMAKNLRKSLRLTPYE